MSDIINPQLVHKYRSAYNPGHDDTQIEYFIVWNNHTDYGRYKQALAEVSSHYESLQNSYILKKKNNAEIGILFAEIEELKEAWSRVDLARVVLKDAEIEEKNLANNSIDKQIERSINELNKNVELAERYEKLIEGKDRKILEKEYHMERLQKLLVLNTAWGGQNLSGVMDIITALPEEEQKFLLNFAGEMNTIVEQSKKLIR